MSNNSTTLNEQRLRECCQEDWGYFEHMLGVKTTNTPGGKMLFKRNGGKILLVAHTDYVCNRGKPDFVSGPHSGTRIVLSPSLDNRLGVYLILFQAWRFGAKYDILLTEGEEESKSTGKYFKQYFPKQKYNWMASFDRMGDDVVTYQYVSKVWEDAIRKSTRRLVLRGSYSDIASMGELGCCGCNIGIGYKDYHTPMSHVFWRDVNSGLLAFANLYRDYGEQKFAHVPGVWQQVGSGGTYQYTGYQSSQRFLGAAQQPVLPTPKVEKVEPAEFVDYDMYRCIQCTYDFDATDYVHATSKCYWCHLGIPHTVEA